MPHALATALALLCIGNITLTSHAADKPGTLIFEDTFDRNESQELKDEVGNGWKTNSRTRAAGNKQVDLRDGAMHIYIHKAADHAVSVVHPAEFQNGTVEIKFMLEHKDDNLGLNFADLNFKQVWAGHLFVVRVRPNNVELTDLKTGNMDLKIRDMRKAGTLPDDSKAMLKTKTKRVPHKTKLGEWHTLRVDIEAETLTATLNGKQVGSFTSPGIAHPTKRLLRLSVPRQAVVDDLKIYKRD